MTLLLALVACAVALPVTAWAEESVSYRDETGTGQVVSAEAVTSNMVTWGGDGSTEHWYVVQNEVTIDQRVTVTGKVHLILADGATLTVDGGIYVVGDNSLSIYGQQGGTGKLIANAESETYYAGIGGNDDREPAGTIAIAGGTVTATGGHGGAGIGGGYLASGGTVTIAGGTVTATGGSLGAGIGGGYGGSGGTVAITSGVVTATGGSGGAGIGGGASGSDGAVTISGGTVDATGGEHGAGIGTGSRGLGVTVTISGGTIIATSEYGAGIGGGWNGKGGTVTISGGTVTATSERGAGIGDGNGDHASDVAFSTGTDGHAVIVASSISDQSGKESGWSGVIFEGDAGKVYGGEVALAENFAVPEGSTLTIPAGSTLEIPEDATLTISTDATLAVSESATVLNAGSITGEGAVSGEGSLRLVDDGSVSVATCTVSMYVTGVAYTDEKGDSAKTAADVQVGVIGSGTFALTDGWYVAKGNVELNQRVTVSGKVHLILADGASLTVNGGINVAEDNSLSIYGQQDGTGKLGADVDPSLQVAGIGGDGNGSAGTILIASGTVTAKGGAFGAGIGNSQYGSCGTITISGGHVTAQGGYGGAGIGCGDGGSGGSVTISGGTVGATGGIGAAGIGGGILGKDVTVTITGGAVTATGGLTGESAPENGAGIGTGARGSNVTFSTGEGGHAVIFASSARDEAISDQSGKDNWSGVIFENSKGEVYGSDVTPTEDFTIPADHALTVPDGSGLTVAKDVTLTNEGTVTLKNGCTFANDGTIINKGKIIVEAGAAVSGKAPDSQEGAGSITKASQTPTASTKDVTSTSLTIESTSSGANAVGQVSYALVKGATDEAPEQSSPAWGNSPDFTGLEPGTLYTAFVSYSGSSYYEYGVSVGVAVRTARATQSLAADQVFATAETAAGASDGTISVSGLAEGATWEWHAAGEDKWTAAEGATVDGLAPGTYEVRLAGSVNYAASAPVPATVQSFADTHGGITFPAGSTDTGDGTVVLPEGGGTVMLPGGSNATLPGGTVVNPGIGTATLPEQGGTVTLPGGSTVTVPGGSVVDLPSGAVTAPDGTAVAPSGDGELGVTFPNGEIVTVPSGSAVGGNGVVTTPDGSVVRPNGSGGITVTLPDGTELAAPSGSTVSADGTVLDPSGNRVGPETPGEVDDGPKDDDSESDDTSKNDDAPGLARTGDATAPVAGVVMAGLTVLLAGLALRPRRR